MSNDTHSGNLLRSNLSGYILDQIDVNRKRFFDLKSAARDKTITRNRLFLEKDSENTYKKKLSQIEDTNKNNNKIKELTGEIVKLKAELEEKVKEINKKDAERIARETELAKEKDAERIARETELAKEKPPTTTEIVRTVQNQLQGQQAPPTATEIVRIVQNQLQGQQAPPTAAKIAAAVENQLQIPTVTDIARAVRNQLQGQQAPPTAADIAREVERQLQIPTAADIARAVQNQIPNARNIAGEVQRQLQIPNTADIAREVLRQLRPEIQGLPTLNQIVAAVENRLQPQLGRIPSIQEIRTELNSRLPPQFVSMPQIQNAINAIPQAPDIRQIREIITREIPRDLQGQITQIVNEIQRIIATQGLNQQNLQNLEQNILTNIARSTGYIIEDTRHQTRTISDDIRNQTTAMTQAVQTVHNAIQNQTLTIQQIANQMMREINQVIPEIQQLTRIEREQMATAIETVINDQREHNRQNRENIQNIVRTIQQSLQDIRNQTNQIPELRRDIRTQTRNINTISADIQGLRTMIRQNVQQVLNAIVNQPNLSPQDIANRVMQGINNILPQQLNVQTAQIERLIQAQNVLNAGNLQLLQNNIMEYIGNELNTGFGTIRTVVTNLIDEIRRDIPTIDQISQAVNGIITNSITHLQADLRQQIQDFNTANNTRQQQTLTQIEQLREQLNQIGANRVLFHTQIMDNLQRVITGNANTANTVNTLQQEIQQMRTELQQSFRTRFDDLQQRLDTIINTNQETHVQLSQLAPTEMVVTLQTSITELGNRIDRYEQTQIEFRNTFNEQINGITASNTTISNRTEQMQTVIENIRNLQEQTGPRYDNLLRELVEIRGLLQTDIAGLDQQRQEMGERIEQINALEMELEAILRDMRGEIQSFRGQINNVRNNIPQRLDIEIGLNDINERERNIAPSGNHQQVLQRLNTIDNTLGDYNQRITLINNNITDFTTEMRNITRLVSGNSDANDEIRDIVRRNSRDIGIIIEGLNLGNNEEEVMNDNVNILNNIRVIIGNIINNNEDEDIIINEEDTGFLQRSSRDLLTLITRYNNLTERNRILTEANETLTEANDTLTEDNDTLTNRNGTLTEANQRLQRQLQECLDNLRTCQAQRDKCQQDLTTCQAQRNQCQQNLENITRLHEECKTLISTLRGQLAQCEQENSNLRRELELCEEKAQEVPSPSPSLSTSTSTSTSIIPSTSPSRPPSLPPSLHRSRSRPVSPPSSPSPSPSRPSSPIGTVPQLQHSFPDLRLSSWDVDPIDLHDPSISREQVINHYNQVDNVVTGVSGEFLRRISHVGNRLDSLHDEPHDLGEVIGVIANRNINSNDRLQRLNAITNRREEAERRHIARIGQGNPNQGLELGIPHRQANIAHDRSYEQGRHDIGFGVSSRHNTGGRTIGDELYENVIFTGGAIIKTEFCKKNNYNNKVNLVIENLFNILDKKKPVIVDKKKQKGGVQTSPEKLESGQLREGITTKMSHLSQIKTSVEYLGNYLRFLGKIRNDYETYKKDVLDILSRHQNGLLKKKEEFKKIDKMNRKSISIGECKNYLTIIKAIMQVWKTSTWDDISYKKGSNFNKNELDIILDELEPVKNKTELAEKITNLYLNKKICLNSEKVKKSSIVLRSVECDIKQQEQQEQEEINIDQIIDKFSLDLNFNKKEWTKETKLKSLKSFNGDYMEKEFKKQFPYIDEKIRVKESLDLVDELYEKYYTVMVRYHNFLENLTKNKNIPSTYVIQLITKPGSEKGTFEYYQNQISQEFLHFFYFSTMLDDFQLLTRRPITLYARINDIGRNPVPEDLLDARKTENPQGDIPEQSFDKIQKKCATVSIKEGLKKWKKTENNEEYKEYFEKQFNEKLVINQEYKLTDGEKFQCSRIEPYDYIQWYERKEQGLLAIDVEKCKLFNGNVIPDNIKRNLKDLTKSTIKFQEVFWRPEFSDNKNISSYMLLDKLILNNIGTYLVTYGYSGVGKSFTLFGDSKLGKSGLLQATVDNISESSSFSALKLRTYELYGLGLGYSDCWKNYNEIDQSIYHYNMKNDFGPIASKRQIFLDNPKIIPRKDDSIPKYISAIHTYETIPKFSLKKEKYDFYREIVSSSNKQQGKTVLKNFTKFIESIEDDRQIGSGGFPKRVNATVNNPKSSRAKLVYDFIFEFKNPKTQEKFSAPLIIDDTPGAENLVESYITKNTDIKFYEKLNKAIISKNLRSLDRNTIWRYGLINATLVNPLFAGIFNSAGILSAFNRILWGIEDDPNIKSAEFAYFYKTIKSDMHTYNKRRTRMSQLFKLFFEYIKKQNIDGVSLGQHVHLNEDGFAFELIESNLDSYSKKCTGVYENKVFAKFFDTKRNKKKYSTELSSVMQDTSQIRPKFQINEQGKKDNVALEKKTMRLAVWLIFKLIKFCSKRSGEGTLKTNEMKYDMLIELLAYSGDISGILKTQLTKDQEEKDRKEKEEAEEEERKAKEAEELHAKKAKKAAEEKRRKKKELKQELIKFATYTSKNKKTKGKKLINDVAIAEQGDNFDSLIIKAQTDSFKVKDLTDTHLFTESGRKKLIKIWKEIKNLQKNLQTGGNKFTVIEEAWNKLPENFKPGLLNKVDIIWKEELTKTFGSLWENKVSIHRKINSSDWRKFRNGPTKIPVPIELKKDFKEARYGYWEMNREHETDYQPYMTYLVIHDKWDVLMKGTKGRENLYKQILFTKIFKPKSAFIKRFRDRVFKEIKNLKDPFFTKPIYNFYAREDFKRYVTLAMESWYIDQNISGILKKCSEISGIDYSTIVNETKGIVPWQYNKEKIPSISDYVDFTSSADQMNEEQKQEKISKQKKILEQYGVPKKELDMYDVGPDNKVSLVSTLEEIETFIDALTSPQADPKEINIDIIDHIQKIYNMEKIFPIDKFPETINKINAEALELIPKDKYGKLKIQNEEHLKPWQKKKIDTVIGVLMDPYVNGPKESKINIQDYKMFYILANNSTQLKCYDQLKTFNMFSKFIRNIKE
jgi:chromosome segregation ATPase